jgi:hypothetical protein
MTPEEITKLARQIAESEWPIDAYGQPASQRCAARITPILTAHLAAREEEYARLRERCEAATAGVEEAAKRIAEKSVPFLITDKGKQDGYPLAGIDIGRYAEAISAELTALLAERDAVLRECQSFIGKLNEKAERFHFADADRDTMASMLSRIDALTKGGGDANCRDGR